MKTGSKTTRKKGDPNLIKQYQYSLQGLDICRYLGVHTSVCFKELTRAHARAYFWHLKGKVGGGGGVIFDLPFIY